MSLNPIRHNTRAGRHRLSKRRQHSRVLPIQLTFGFEGIVFDEISVDIEVIAGEAFGIDDLQFNTIPEPILGLMCSLVFTAGLLHRRRQS